MLNSIPGYLVRGENWDALHHLFRFHRTLVEGSQKWDAGPAAAAHPPVLRRRRLPGAQVATRAPATLVLDTVLRPRDDTRVTGFKEIRWYRDDVEEYVAWLREVFPGARFVVNTRDHDEVRRSGWWAKRPENAESLPRVEARILALADGLGDAAYRVHYNDYVADPSVLRGLFDWLGEPFDEAAVRTVLETRHSVCREPRG